MARVTHVKKAQPRYKTVPDLDENGVQKTVAVMNSRTGEPRKSKSGRETVRRLTKADKTQPLPNRKCDKCGQEIEVGTAYKWIAPKSGPYGGTKRFRHEGCATWQVWEYSSSLSARVAQIQHEAEQSQPGEADVDDMRSYLEGVAEQIRELAEEKRESASSIEEGFGHATYQSEELNETADSLESWADDIENTDLEDVPEECDEHQDEFVEDCTCEEDELDEGECDNCQEKEAREACEACEARENFDEDQWIATAVEEIENCPV